MRIAILVATPASALAETECSEEYATCGHVRLVETSATVWHGCKHSNSGYRIRRKYPQLSVSWF